MPVFQRLIDLDQLFYSLDKEPIIINNLNIDTSEKSDELKNLIYTSYSSDVMKSVPTCLCGHLSKEYLIGEVCHKCNNPVKEQDTDIEPILWIEALEGTSGFFNPHAWLMINTFFSKRSFNIISWITNSRYRSKAPTPDYVSILEDLPNFSRSYNYFLDNFDTIFNILINLKDFKTKRIMDMEEFIRNNRDILIVQKLPVPNKTLLVIENTTKGVFFNFEFAYVIDAVYSVIGAATSNGRNIENRAVGIMEKISGFYESYYKNMLSGKPGLIRKHIFGTRTHFSFRGVITSITGPHQIDEIEIPWAMALTTYRPTVINKLLRSGMTIKEAVNYLYAHVNKYSDLLNDIFEEMIEETRDGRLPINFQRNPSLKQGSSLLLWCRKIKTNVSDYTISLSILLVGPLCADFDGDEMNGSVAVDNITADRWKNLEFHHNILSDTDVLEINGNLQIPKPVVTTISNWLSHSSENITLEQEKTMLDFVNSL